MSGHRCERCGARGACRGAHLRRDGTVTRRIHCSACPHRWTIRGGEWRRPRQTRVRCVETGQEFVSITTAARSCYVTPQTLWQAVARGQRAGGYRWERVGPA